ncbi:hypothetical protein [Lactococcus garvieae]|jgi:putative ABC transport system ATP-binding protein|uniref:hypothetical protein n=1 Tax=Lactococcus garvieae TaxID=1363 RepID=UPI0002DF0297|nr:hypothetical protein [Lactococcus garvieae]MDN5628167.1 hypothetical protein [Lactococcus sp.]MBS4463871.1 hypothetical protein [Lactococcus garvieae]MCO7129619.1 hypothetical protein [Lactococcus garvieae]MDB7635307.1 hypothetical protein [Lactococcus garvieae]QSQ99226.1 hypothetical protein J0J32_08475 [Lactococcus garvieae]
MIELQEVTKKFSKHQIFDRYSLSISADNLEELHSKKKQAGFEVAELKGLPH